MLRAHAQDVEQARGESLPRPEDSERVFNAKKARLMARVVPMTLIPLSSANGMLVVGSGLKEKTDCYFPLMHFLLIGGAVSLSLVVMAVASQHMFEWILYDRVITRTGQWLMAVLRWLGTGLALVQILMIVAGSILIFPEYRRVSYDRTSDMYCNEGAVIFSTFLLVMCWVFIAFAGACYVYIHCVEGRRHRLSTVVSGDMSEQMERLMNVPSTSLMEESPPKRKPPTYKQAMDAKKKKG